MNPKITELRLMVAGLAQELFALSNNYDLEDPAQLERSVLLTASGTQLLVAEAQLGQSEQLLAALAPKPSHPLADAMRDAANSRIAKTASVDNIASDAIRKLNEQESS